MQVSTSMDTENGGMVVKRLSVPVGLEELMESLTKEVLSKKPQNVYSFASDHFSNLLDLREKGGYKEVKKQPSIVKPVIKEIVNCQKSAKKIKAGVTSGKQLSRQMSIRPRSPLKKIPPSNKITTKRNVKAEKNRNILDKHKSLKSMELDSDKLKVEGTRAKRSISVENIDKKSKKQVKESASNFNNKDKKTLIHDTHGKGNKLTTKITFPVLESSELKLQSNAIKDEQLIHETAELLQSQSKASVTPVIQDTEITENDNIDIKQDNKDENKENEKCSENKEECVLQISDDKDKKANSYIQDSENENSKHDQAVIDINKTSDNLEENIKTNQPEINISEVTDLKQNGNIKNMQDESTEPSNLPPTLINTDEAENLDIDKSDDATSYHPEKLRKELEEVEMESRLSNFTSTYNPYLLRSEIRNASSENGNATEDENKEERDANKSVENNDQFANKVMAVLKIQSVWRKFRNKNSKKSDKTVEINAPENINSSVDKDVVELSDGFLKQAKAVIKIQSLWRAFKARQLYKEKLALEQSECGTITEENKEECQTLLSDNVNLIPNGTKNDKSTAALDNTLKEIGKIESKKETIGEEDIESKQEIKDNKDIESKKETKGDVGTNNEQNKLVYDPIKLHEELETIQGTVSANDKIEESEINENLAQTENEIVQDNKIIIDSQNDNNNENTINEQFGERKEKEETDFASDNRREQELTNDLNQIDEQEINTANNNDINLKVIAEQNIDEIRDNEVQLEPAQLIKEEKTAKENVCEDEHIDDKENFDLSESVSNSNIKEVSTLENHAGNEGNKEKDLIISTEVEVVSEKLEQENNISNEKQNKCDKNHEDYGINIGNTVIEENNQKITEDSKAGLQRPSIENESNEYKIEENNIDSPCHDQNADKKETEKEITSTDNESKESKVEENDNKNQNYDKNEPEQAVISIDNESNESKIEESDYESRRDDQNYNKKGTDKKLISTDNESKIEKNVNENSYPEQNYDKNESEQVIMSTGNAGKESKIEENGNENRHHEQNSDNNEPEQIVISTDNERKESKIEENDIENSRHDKNFNKNEPEQVIMSTDNEGKESKIEKNDNENPHHEQNSDNNEPEQIMISTDNERKESKIEENDIENSRHDKNFNKNEPEQVIMSIDNEGKESKIEKNDNENHHHEQNSDNKKPEQIIISTDNENKKIKIEANDNENSHHNQNYDINEPEQIIMSTESTDKVIDKENVETNQNYDDIKDQKDDLKTNDFDIKKENITICDELKEPSTNISDEEIAKALIQLDKLSSSRASPEIIQSQENIRNSPNPLLRSMTVDEPKCEKTIVTHLKKSFSFDKLNRSDENEENENRLSIDNNMVATNELESTNVKQEEKMLKDSTQLDGSSSHNKSEAASEIIEKAENLNKLSKEEEIEATSIGHYYENLSTHPVISDESNGKSTQEIISNETVELEKHFPGTKKGNLLHSGELHDSLSGSFEHVSAKDIENSVDDTSSTTISLQHSGEFHDSIPENNLKLNEESACNETQDLIETKTINDACISEEETTTLAENNLEVNKHSEEDNMKMMENTESYEHLGVKENVNEENITSKPQEKNDVAQGVVIEPSDSEIITTSGKPKKDEKLISNCAEHSSKEDLTTAIAATKIQSAFRGHRVRRDLNSQKKSEDEELANVKDDVDSRNLTQTVECQVPNQNIGFIEINSVTDHEDSDSIHKNSELKDQLNDKPDECSQTENIDSEKNKTKLNLENLSSLPTADISNTELETTTPNITPRLLHSSEHHDDISLPTLHGTSEIMFNEEESKPDCKELQTVEELHRNNEKVSLPSDGEKMEDQNDAVNITTESNRLDQDSAGAEILTSQTSDAFNVVDNSKAQASNKDASTCASTNVPDSDTKSSESGMEAEKRNNSAYVKKNMETEAATKIQAGFRGYQVRKQLKQKIGGIDITSPKRLSRRKSSGRITDSGRTSQNKNKPSDVEEKSATKIQAGIRGFLVRRRQQKTKKSGNDSY